MQRHRKGPHDGLPASDLVKDVFETLDLHQLRGRVGRSNQKAYCYLLSPPDELLSSDARRRLRAIDVYKRQPSTRSCRSPSSA